MKTLIALILSVSLSAFLFAEAPRVFPEGVLPNDARLQPLKNLNGFFPLHVPDSLGSWEARASELRRRVLVANGLWPMPEKTPLNAVVHGKIHRPGFTVEKVYFESVPGLYVTGLLFRPDQKLPKAGFPAVLSPHGHGGRLQDHGPEEILNQINQGAERFEDSGRFPKMARAATLARLGCVTFLYDMMGYADNQQLSREFIHKFAEARPDFEGKKNWGLFSAQAELRLQSGFGIHTWNSIRALDFLEALPDTDPQRIGVTGGSGGGTQAIILCAIDPRPVVAFPNGMVSSSMQGGCTCENASLLRIGTGNVELAALFAPKPQAMTAADDWTKEMLIPGKGFPELQALYRFYGKTENVACSDLTHFKHNYNYVTRGKMYSWFNQHLGLGHSEPFVEADFKSLTIEEHAVWNKEHPAPAGGPVFERKLTRWLADDSDKQLAALSPKKRQEILGGAWRTMIGRGLPNAEEVSSVDGILSLKPLESALPLAEIASRADRGPVVVWVDGRGKNGLFGKGGKPIDQAQRLADQGYGVIAADLFMQGEFLMPGEAFTKTDVVEKPRDFAGYTHGYNDSVFASRVHDVLTLIAYAEKRSKGGGVHLVGTHGAGPLVLAARALAGEAIDKSVVFTEGFRFADIVDYRDPNFIPGAVKYGDLPGLLELSASGDVWISGETSATLASARAAFKRFGGALSLPRGKGDLRKAVDWLLAE